MTAGARKLTLMSSLWRLRGHPCCSARRVLCKQDQWAREKTLVIDYLRKHRCSISVIEMYSVVDLNEHLAEQLYSVQRDAARAPARCRMTHTRWKIGFAAFVCIDTVTLDQQRHLISSIRLNQNHRFWVDHSAQQWINGGTRKGKV